MARKNAAQKAAQKEKLDQLKEQDPDEYARLEAERAGKSKKQMHRKDKPWDVEGTDHWKVDPWAEGEMRGPLLEESSFATVCSMAV
jgi:ribosomal RNA assembly protein